MLAGVIAFIFQRGKGLLLVILVAGKLLAHGFNHIAHRLIVANIFAKYVWV